MRKNAEVYVRPEKSIPFELRPCQDWAREIERGPPAPHPRTLHSSCRNKPQHTGEARGTCIRPDSAPLTKGARPLLLLSATQPVLTARHRQQRLQWARQRQHWTWRQWRGRTLHWREPVLHRPRWRAIPGLESTKSAIRQQQRATGQRQGRPQHHGVGRHATKPAGGARGLQKHRGRTWGGWGRMMIRLYGLKS